MAADETDVHDAIYGIKNYFSTFLLRYRIVMISDFSLNSEDRERLLKESDHAACRLIEGGPMNGNNRSDIAPGMRVRVVRKEDQRSGSLTEGVVRDLLTKSPHHPHGIKVRLEGGIVGRVKEILGA